MKSKLLTVSLLASAMFAGLGAVPAMAQSSNTPRIDQAQQAIAVRIQQGIQSGRITQSEAQALYGRDREIQNREAQFKANGSASFQERQALRVDLDNLSADVERMINNNVVAGQQLGSGSTSTPRHDEAQQNISARIQRGLQSGQITPSEAQELYRREHDLQTREAQYKANGDITPQERQALRSELDSLRAEVDRLIHNKTVVGQQPVYGNTGTPGIDNREMNISRRIDEGVSSGRISENEARRLHMRERMIANHEARFKSDGVVTQQERRQLRNELAALSSEVERMIHNGRRNRG
jgi:hypothetical protein